MIAKSTSTVLFIFLLCYFSYATSSETQNDNKISAEADSFVGDIKAGEERYKETCANCHGAGGRGVASYPKVSGNDISYTKEKLETYREGIKIGPNSSLMIMMAKPLTDEEIANLAAYLKEEKN